MFVKTRRNSAETRAQSTHVFHQEHSPEAGRRVEGGSPEPYFTTACHGAKINVLRIECVLVRIGEERANVIKAAFIGHIRCDLDRRSPISFRQTYTTRIAQNDWKQLRGGKNDAYWGGMLFFRGNLPRHPSHIVRRVALRISTNN